MTRSAAAEAIFAGGVVVLPTDTVYGLVADAREPAACDALYALKGRDARKPSALIASSVSVLLAFVPELPVEIVRALLPGPYTLVLPNPAQRFAWFCGEAPTSIGVRVPSMAGPGKVVLDEVGAVAATSANLPGGAEPRRLDDVPAALRSAVAVVVDGGELPGTPSTVIDLTGAVARVSREGAGDSAAALAILARLRLS